MSDADSTNESKVTGDLRDIFKQFAQPVLDSLDHRLRGQIDSRVDERVAAILADRLAVLERAVADLDRAVRELHEKLDEKRPELGDSTSDED